MVCISGGLEAIQDRKHTNPFQPGDIVQWTPSTHGKDIPDHPVLATVKKAMVGIDEDNPNLVRCHIEYWGQRFSVGVADLKLYKRPSKDGE